MKKILIALLLSSVFSFGQSNQKETSTLENEFSKSTLDAENIIAFETRSKQKVVDFCNYIQLISNKDLDDKLRLHSQKSALTLFNTNSCLISEQMITGKNDYILINDFFSAVYKSKYHKIEGLASNVVFKDQLTAIDSSNYAGTISYTHTMNFYNQAGNIIKTIIENKFVEVTLTRKVKTFGTTEKIIWTVNLCDIKND